MAGNSFAPKSFFFTDPAAFTQSAAQAFGPLSGNQLISTNKQIYF